MSSGVPWSNKPDYDPDLWTNQTDTINLVLTQARLIARGIPADRRGFVFRGRRGAGKTWLLRRLQEHLSVDEFSEFHVHFLDLAEGYDLNRLVSMLDEPGPQVLLIDNVTQADKVDLDILEDQFLTSLINKPNTLVVMAQAGSLHAWQSFFLHEKSEEQDLQSFEPKYIAEQLDKLKTKHPGHFDSRDVDLGLLERYGAGFPWSTYVLAGYLPDKKAALEQCVNALLSGINDAHLRLCLKALCVLKAFSAQYMEQFLPYYPPLAHRKWDSQTCRDLCRRLRTTKVVRWDKDRRGFVIDEPVRLVLEACLAENTPAEWQALHCTAYRLCSDWAKRYPYASDWWQQLATYHHTCLGQADFNPADCPERSKPEEEETDGD